MSSTKHPLRVFLCHASGDKPAVIELYNRLVKDGVDAWLDKEKLIPGQNWQFEIPKAVKNSDIVVVCLSPHSITKEGFVQKEIKFALDAAEEKLDDTIFIIPARLEICSVPDRINMYQWVDLFLDDGYERLFRALQTRANELEINIGKSPINPAPKVEPSHPLKPSSVVQIHEPPRKAVNENSFNPLIIVWVLGILGTLSVCGLSASLSFLFGLASLMGEPITVEYGNTTTEQTLSPIWGFLLVCLSVIFGISPFIIGFITYPLRKRKEKKTSTL